MNQLTMIDSRTGVPQASAFMPGLRASQVSRSSLTETPAHRADEETWSFADAGLHLAGNGASLDKGSIGKGSIGRSPKRVSAFGADALVDPGSTFEEPSEVLEHPSFSPEEKRAILLSWVRDELLLEQVAHNTLPELRPRSRIDAVIEALSQFDRLAAAEYRRAVASIRASYPRRASDGKDRDGSRRAKSPRSDKSPSKGLLWRNVSWRSVTCTSAASV